MAWVAACCHGRLCFAAAGQRLVPRALRPDPGVPGALPDFAVRALLHDRARELLDVRLRPADRARLRMYASVIEAGIAVAPDRIRYPHPARTA